MAARGTLFSSKKIIRTKGIELKNEYIVKFEFKITYAQFAVCIQETRQWSGYECSLAAAAHTSSRSERDTLQ